ncbi:hypothetical protein DY000_02045599 [Brassica cretica]|uniref:Uncharacterized protein n=1 Tax=Brassica cretica TaxID=69181 RepID=A0ABQ7EZR5_BRACR|nr:hypothetical protein DY000_02045599 [Brassica cretica]
MSKPNYNKKSKHNYFDGRESTGQFDWTATPPRTVVCTGVESRLDFHHRGDDPRRDRPEWRRPEKRQPERRQT